MTFRIKVETALALGVTNLGRVFLYRLGVKSGLNPVKRLVGSTISGPFFHLKKPPQLPRDLVNCTTAVKVKPFGLLPETEFSTIDWSKSCLTNKRSLNDDKPWYEIEDFNAELGDIKGIWEASRFDWLFQYCQSYLLGDHTALIELNRTLDNWNGANPPYLGPNWKCGQEASIRVMHIAMAAKLLNQIKTSEPALLSFVKSHLKRIAPTISYAIAQDNNHGTSEAAALFIGGSWLDTHNDSEGKKWMTLGRKWLENRAKRLIGKDGSFSQYSTNYHRVMLDSYSMVEIWRVDLGLAPFSDAFYLRMKAATNWLYQFTQSINGDVPNLGANDGARLLPLTNTDYRDFRPSVQLAAVLFHHAVAWEAEGDYDFSMKWLGLTRPLTSLDIQESFHFEDAGYFGLRAASNAAFVLMTYPKFRFRPSQCDALHIDFWFQGENLLRDGGTFSYNAGERFINYYGGVKSHNTVQFDDRDQMPRLSRFLLGGWLKAKQVNCDLNSRKIKAGYSDSKAAFHLREVSITDSKLTVIDNISNFTKKAVLRWRLKPSNWYFEGQTVTDGNHAITIKPETLVKRIALVQGKESRYYFHEADIPVLEIEVHSAGRIIMEYTYQK
ncbi:heparinase [Shewanella sp. OPT22]|nr:heparinase [Shewanella sp. OPT22]